MIRCEVAVLALLVSVPLLQDPAPDPARASSIRIDGTTMVIPAGKHGVRELVDATARFLKWNILCQEAELAGGGGGPIELQNPLTLDAAGCEAAVGQLLWSHGYLLVQRDVPSALYELLSESGKRAAETMLGAPFRTPEEILAQPRLLRPVRTLFPLHLYNATIAVNSLRPFFAIAGSSLRRLGFGSGGDNRSLLLSGLQCDVAEALLLLQKAEGQFIPLAVEKDLGARFQDLESKVHRLSQRLDDIDRRVAAIR